ncbi:MAG: NACHT domain-containing protein [Rhodococcus sp. (in: high G+C Gram-positive bacteria)]
MIILLDDGTLELVTRWLLERLDRFAPVFVQTLLLLVATWLVINAFAALIEALAKALEAYKNVGFPVSVGRSNRIGVRRRRQFCKVVHADLAVLAKRENWNDQYFTDLEADVEVDGEYYPSLLHRLLRRRRHGLRRVPSIIEAIATNSERCLLVIGEPGSGKSVALRHLASELAEKGIRSSALDAKVPLYVNLKELVVPVTHPVTAATIKEFVFENVRRGDADTVAFVKEHWSEYKDRGNWFFLFDSFDEIPAVLHAPSGSAVIREYAEAVRQFLESQSDCRAVLASREFKGPDELPWHRLRILPLSSVRQNELITNSFLNEEKRELAHSHITVTDSSFYSNPMFLTLLCRYVRDLGTVPGGELDLLSGHIDRLASRDDDYLQRRYRIGSKELVTAATRLSVLFAEKASLGLAPTRDELAAAGGETLFADHGLDLVLAALVDVKIGRSDVEEARPGDRRFTFSHRRYQETLFAKYLAEHQGHIDAETLLTAGRWREYAVTLLQTATTDRIQALLTSAEHLVRQYGTRARKVRVPSISPGIHVYLWNPAEVHMLQLLQEGLGRRKQSVPRELSASIADLLTPRWADGDIIDRCKVIELGGLLPDPILGEFISSAAANGPTSLREIAYKQSIFLITVPDSVAAFIRTWLADEVLAAHGPTGILRVLALMHRLPDDIGAVHVYRRCMLLRKAFITDTLLQRLVARTYGVMTDVRHSPSMDTRRRLRQFSSLVVPLLGVLVSVVALLVLNLPLDAHSSRSGQSYWMLFTLVLASYLPFMLWVAVQWRFRAEGRPITAGLVLSNSIPSGRSVLAATLTILAIVVLLCLLLVAPGLAVTWIVEKLLGGELAGGVLFALYSVSATAAVGALAGLVSLVERRSRTRAIRHLTSERTSGVRGFELALTAESANELATWLRSSPDLLLTSPLNGRFLVRIALGEYDVLPSDPPLVRFEWDDQEAMDVFASIYGVVASDAWLLEDTLITKEVRETAMAWQQSQPTPS